MQRVVQSAAPSPVEAEDANRGPSAWPLVAICVGYFMVILDTTVVNVALPALSRGLQTTTTGLQWVVDAYSLSFAALLLSGGALGDRRGAKAVFEMGLGVFVVCSLACGLAPSTGWLIGARVAQGVGAALAVPASLALLQAAYKDRARRRRAFGIWGGVAGIAAGGGPVLGGLLVSGLGWRSVFFLNVPIGIAGLMLAARTLPAVAGRAHGTDPVGQLTGALCLGALTVALIEAGSAGWGAPVVLASFAATVLLGSAFLAVERHVASPMLPLGLFSSRTFSGATVVGLCLNLGFYGELFVLTLYLQQHRGYSSLLAGLALLPQMAMAAIGSVLSGRIMARTGPRPPMLAGLALGAAGLLALAPIGLHTPYALLVAPFVAVGLGMSMTMPAATTAVMEATPSERGGLASGTLNAARQIGGVLGVALLGSLVADADFSGGLHASMAVAGGAFLLGLAFSALFVERESISRAGRRAESVGRSPRATPPDA